jgi:uncharacterized protein (TIGR02001 family)
MNTILTLLVVIALAAPAAWAQQPMPGNLALVSEYRFRGIDQTFGKPALQGGLDYNHASGAYIGNWNSNVNQGAGYPGATLEMDFYGGYKRALGDVGADIGLIHYHYPGSDVKNTEAYLGATWKWFAAKWFRALGDYFSVPGSRGTMYLDLAAVYDFGGGWGTNAHFGHLAFKNASNASYSDYRIAATREMSGWVLGAAYVATNAKGNCSAVPAEFYCFSDGTGSKSRDAGRSTIVFSVGKTF